MFHITDSKIDIDSMQSIVTHDSAGGFVCFEGWVRDNNEGSQVTGLSYDMYDELTINEGQKILAEAEERFSIISAAAVHRKGELEIGDLAVWIGVSSAHRDAAFKACRFIIDEIKDRLPIWKKEHYISGHSHWINCQGCYHGHSSIKVDRKELFSKQTKLSQVGQAGQERLQDSHVLVIGAGGLGCPALTYLAAAGIGRITIYDGDKVEASNLHRQTLFGWQDIGQQKATVAKHRLLAMMPDLKVTAVTERLTINQLPDALDQVDLVLDCTDNFSTKFLVHDACYLAQKPLIQASIYQWEGQINSFDFRESQPGCLRCLYPETPEDGCVANCVEAGVIGPIPGALGTLQALEAIKAIVGHEEWNTKETILFDLQSLTSQKLRRPTESSCPLCSDGAKINAKTFKSMHQLELDIDITSSDLSRWERFRLVDIRGPLELSDADPGHEFLEHYPAGIGLERNEWPIVIVCQKGIRSHALAQKLRKDGWSEVYSLSEGIHALAKNCKHSCK